MNPDNFQVPVLDSPTGTFETEFPELDLAISNWLGSLQLTKLGNFMLAMIGSPNWA